MFKGMHVITKIALILGFGCLVADIVAIQVGAAKPLTPDMVLVLDLGYCVTWIYVAMLERKLMKAGIAL